ncbi:hypothetical protein ACIO3S_24365 [Nocardioides sp. NPDC087217]|uniref:hypothetical protein n=1 Tax=Nocardioides sp. NPDC087217 TaxID=3364335 RepID=UPI00382540BC
MSKDQGKAHLSGVAGGASGVAGRSALSLRQRRPDAPKVFDDGFEVEGFRLIEESGKWASWAAAEPDLAAYADLGEVRLAWERRRPNCYLGVAALTRLGSTRGGDDHDAALAVVVLLHPGLVRMIHRLSPGLCEIDEARSMLWEKVKAAEPNAGPMTVQFLLDRVRQTDVIRPFLPRQEHERSLEGLIAAVLDGTGDQSAVLGETEDEGAASELGEVLTWCVRREVITADDSALLTALVQAACDGLGTEEAMTAVGTRQQVCLRTIRRRRDRAIAKIRSAVPAYLAAVA